MPRAVNSNAREGYMCVGAIVCGHPAGELETMACVFIECSFGLNTTGPEEGEVAPELTWVTAYTRHGWGGRAASLPPVHACSTTSAPVERRRCRGVTREKNKVRDGSGESRMKHRLIALCLYTLHHWHFTVPQKFLWLLL